MRNRSLRPTPSPNPNLTSNPNTNPNPGITNNPHPWQTHRSPPSPHGFIAEVWGAGHPQLAPPSPGAVLRSAGVNVTPTSSPSGERNRLTVCPHGSVLFLTSIR